MSYIVYKGLPIEELNFNIVRAKSTKYRNKYICDDVMCFDTEATNGFIINNKVVPFDYNNPKPFKDCEKHSLVYFWSFAINDNVYIGRELYDFVYLIHDLHNCCPFYKIIYIHNLSYDFNFLLNILKFDSVFARKTRHPLVAEIYKYKLEFRCSYLLTNLSLENWGDAYNLSIKKKVGSLDYSKIRTPLTPMTDEEIEYGVYDVLTMVAGLTHYKNQYEHIYNIPLTHTGKMRRECEKVMANEIYYNKKISDLIPKSLVDYKEQCDAFIGGTVLCNWIYKDRVVFDLEAWDIASSYPFVLVTGLYPMSKFYTATRDYEQYMYNKDYLYLVKFKATGVESNYNCHFLSKSKANSTTKAQVDNGRIIRADEIIYTLTSIDYELFLKCYTSQSIEIISFKWCKAGYLNNNFRKFILKLYADKTTLKGVDGMYNIYMNKKEYINSAYGDFVTKIFADDIVFDFDKSLVDYTPWEKEELTEEKYQKKLNTVLKKQHKNYKAFIHGVFVTANARKRLWDAITYQDMDDHMVYTDTDSIKAHHYTGDFFEKENKRVMELNKKVAKDLGVNIELFEPEDKFGTKHPIGVWEHEDTYEEFKSLGCKQYIYKSNGKLHLTCAGVSKLAVKCFKSVDDFEIDRQLTEKELHNCKDDKGHTAEKLIPYYSTNYGKVVYPDGYVSNYRCGICLMPTTFNLSMSITDIYYLFNEVREKETEIFLKSSQLDSERSKYRWLKDISISNVTTANIKMYAKKKGINVK